VGPTAGRPAGGLPTPDRFLSGGHLPEVGSEPTGRLDLRPHGCRADDAAGLESPAAPIGCPGSRGQAVAGHGRNLAGADRQAVAEEAAAVHDAGLGLEESPHSVACRDTRHRRECHLGLVSSEATRRRGRSRPPRNVARHPWGARDRAAPRAAKATQRAPRSARGRLDPAVRDSRWTDRTRKRPTARSPAGMSLPPGAIPIGRSRAGGRTVGGVRILRSRL